jgi:hypothetical protein
VRDVQDFSWGAHGPEALAALGSLSNGSGDTVNKPGTAGIGTARSSGHRAYPVRSRPTINNTSQLTSLYGLQVAA